MTTPPKLHTIHIGQTIKIGDREFDPNTIGKDITVHDYGDLAAVTLTIIGTNVRIAHNEVPKRADIRYKTHRPRNPEEI